MVGQARPAFAADCAKQGNVNVGQRPNLTNRDNMISGVIAETCWIAISKERFDLKRSARRTALRGQWEDSENRFARAMGGNDAEVCRSWFSIVPAYYRDQTVRWSDRKTLREEVRRHTSNHSVSGLK